MGARKSSEVKKGVDLVLSGRAKSIYEAAKLAGVAESSIHRDPRIIAWKANNQEKGSRK